MQLKFLIIGMAMTLTAATQAGTEPGKKLPLCPQSPNCVSSQAADAEHFIAPFKITATPENAWTALKQALLGQSRTVITAQSAEALHAEATSLVFRFVDDIDAILDAEVKLIHVRSASRTGYYDFGVNRKRIETLRAAMRKQGVIE